MNNNNINGIPGIGSMGDNGDAGNRGYNIFYYADAINSQQPISIEASINYSNNEKEYIYIKFASDNLVAEIIEYKIDENNNILYNNLPVKRVLESNETRYLIDLILDTKYNIKYNDINVNKIKISFNINDCKITLIGNNGTTELTYIANILKDKKVLPFDVIQVNSGDYVLDKNLYFYAIKKETDKINFIAINNIDKTSFFNIDASILSTDKNLLIGSSLYNIREIYDNNLNDSKLLIVSDTSFINIENKFFIDTDDNKDYYIGSNSPILINNLYINKINDNNILLSPDLMNNDVIKLIKTDISNNIINIDLSAIKENAESELKNIMIYDNIIKKIIKKFNDTLTIYNYNIETENPEINLTFFHKFKYNNISYINSIHKYVASDSLYITNNKVLDSNFKIDCNNLEVKINNANTASNVKFDLIFNKDISDISCSGVNTSDDNTNYDVSASYEESDKKIIKISSKPNKDGDYKYNNIKETITLDLTYTTETGSNKDTVVCTINRNKIDKPIEHKNIFNINEPAGGYLVNSTIDKGVPVSAVLQTFIIDCIDISSSDISVSCDVSIKSSKPIGMIYYDISIWDKNFENMGDVSLTSETPKSMIHSINKPSEKISIKKGDKKVITVFTDFLNNENISLPEIELDTVIYITAGEEKFNKERITRIYPIQLSCVNVSPNHNYDISANDYIYDATAYNCIYSLYNINKTRFNNVITLSSYTPDKNAFPIDYQNFFPSKEMDEILLIEYDTPILSKDTDIEIKYKEIGKNVQSYKPTTAIQNTIK